MEILTVTDQSEKNIAAVVAAEEQAWNHAEDEHERTERQVETEMSANQKAAQAAKTDPKSTESKGKPS